jgi:shikimate 5-dehydrogenase
MQAAREGGARACNGLGMLACQGALAFELWTSIRPDAALMLDTLRQLVNPT